MEIFIFVEAGGAATNIDIIPFAGCTLSADGDWDASSCESPESAFQFSMLEVIRACGSAQSFNARVHSILRDVSIQSEQLGQEDEGSEIQSTSTKARRLSGVIRLFEDLGHIGRQIERYKPDCWW